MLICWFNAALRAAQEGLRRSESNFRSLVTNAPYGICRCDSPGNLLDVNPALVATAGLRLGSGIDRPAILAHSTPTAQQVVRCWPTTCAPARLSRAGGGMETQGRQRPRRCALSGRAVATNRGMLVFELFTEDVTERRALEQQLRQSQKMEAIGRLAGGIAHDFNNLLMVISGYSEFLLERLGAGSARCAVRRRRSASAAERATSLTRQLLAFSRKQMLAPKVLDLNDVVTENLKMLTRLIGEDIDLVMVPGPNCGAVRADPGQIEQVIMNLAVNARDAMPHGGRLTIETANVTLDEAYARFHAPVQPGDYVMLAISDTGVGMDNDTQSHIFEPFFTTKGTKGTGLGLSTVYGIVKQSGGYIWVYSEAGQGDVVQDLPAARDRYGESAAAREQPASGSRGGANRGPRETILLVEDEANLRRLARQYPGEPGLQGDWRPLTARPRCRSAVAHQGTIHLLLTDVIMPGMNGRELAQRISEIRPNMKVLYMSGYTENAIGHNGTLDAGIRLLQKPFTLHALKAKCAKCWINTNSPGGCHVMQSAVINPRRGCLGTKFRASARNGSICTCRLRYRRVGRTRVAARAQPRTSAVRVCSFRPRKSCSPTHNWKSTWCCLRKLPDCPTEVVCRGEVVRTVETTGSTTESRAGGEDPAVSLPARVTRVGSVVRLGRCKVGRSRALSSARSLRFCGEWVGTAALIRPYGLRCLILERCFPRTSVLGFPISPLPG